MPSQDVILQQVSCRFGDVAAVDAIDLHIAAGQMVTLLGPSGCGKTTTLRMLAGLEKPTGGRILIGDQDITTRATHERDIGMVFQSYALFPHLSVADNVGFGLVAQRVSAHERHHRVQEALQLVGLPDLGRRRPAELSGGQQQRVALARALVLRPALLLLDEPLSNLDAALRQRMRTEIRALQQSLGLTALYVTHDQEEALAVSDQIVLMRRGRIEQRGTPIQIVQTPANAFVAQFIGQSVLLPVHDVHAVDGSGKDINVRCGPLQVRLPAPSTWTTGADLSRWRLAVRPWAGQMSPGDNAQVSLVRFLGHYHEVALDLGEGIQLCITVAEPSSFVPSVGTRCRADLHPRGCALVQADTPSHTA